MLTLLCLNNNNSVLRYFSLKKKNIIKINNNNQMMGLYNNFEPIIPKGIISNIKINIRNHRYEINNFKKNIFRIDRNIPLIFCLAYYENIRKFNSCYITTEYKITFNKFVKKNTTHKVKYYDNLNTIFTCIISI